MAAAYLTAGPGPEFDGFFMDKTLRVDVFHTADAALELFTLDKLYAYGTWAGSRTHLIDSFNNGRYYIKVYDKTSGSLLYSKGFNSYCGEYTTTGEAAEGIKKTYHETALIPFPKKTIDYAIEKRNRKYELEEIFRLTIDPRDVGIIRDKILDQNVQVFTAHKSGPPHQCVDIVILGEGYTRKETGKFKEDLKRHADIFFQWEPYRSYKNKFNISGVLKPSEESGTDEPRAGIFKNTALNSSFNAFGSERYLLTEDNRSLRDIASFAPYDAVMILVNHSRYGGGGIYNFYCTFTADTPFHSYIFIHEFGHSFAGLADEYYTSSVSYNDFYPRGMEPLEPNITALLDPANPKWKNLIDENISIPTPWEKKAFDEMDAAWQKKRGNMNEHISELKRTGAPTEKIARAQQEYDKLDREHSMKVDVFLKESRYWGKVGAFEGAGYSSKGLYRPMLNCIMFSKGEKPFCKICEAAIRKVILHTID
ncbi:MAG: peptidase M64 [Candidatus Aminicenantes bacterium]|nr:peptidase M64 [Candidatus Aminicenantes bacterium]